MNKEEILRQELRVLEELKQLEEEGEEEQEQGQSLYDLSGLRALTDPRNLSRLRSLMWPGI